MSGSPEVGPEHLGILVDALWENLGEQATVSGIISDVVGSGDDAEAKKLLEQAEEIGKISEDKFFDLVPDRWMDFLQAVADFRTAIADIQHGIQSIQSMAIGERKVYASECLAKVNAIDDEMVRRMSDAKLEGGN